MTNLFTFLLVLFTLNANALTVCTRDSLVSWITNATLTTGENYQVSDRDSIILTAISVNTINPQTSGLLFVADYLGNGNYSSGTQLGVWKSTLTTPINDWVCWNGLHYQNITGTNNNTSPDSNPSNWQLFSPSITNGYLKEFFYLEYDIIEDEFLYKADLRGNKFTTSLDAIDEIGYNPINEFQWGSVACMNNTIIRGRLMNINQIVELGNFTYDNTVLNGAILDASNNQGEVFYNVVDSRSTLIIPQNSGKVLYNNLRTSNSTITAVNNSGVIDDNLIFNGTIMAVNNSGNIRSTTMYNGTLLQCKDNTGSFGANHLTIGAQLIADYNSGIIRWNQLSNTTILNANNNQGNIERVIQNGNFTAYLKRDSGKSLTFLRLDLIEDLTIESSISLSYKYFSPYNNLK